MKWLLLVFAFSTTFAQTPEQELIAKVFKLLTRDEKAIVVYENQPLISLKGSSFELLTHECNNAGLIYGSMFESLPAVCAKLPHFAIDYEVFQKDKNAIGAFYWRKGRPQLRFSKERCATFNIILPPELAQYVQ